MLNSAPILEKHLERTAEEALPPGVLDILLALVQRKKLILGMSVLGGVITAGVTLLIAPAFTATSVIMPPQQQQPMTSAILGQLGSLAGIAGGSLGLKNPAELYIGILSGRTIADSLIEAYDLKRLYKAKTTVDARKELAKRSTFASGKDSLIKISVDDNDPKRAAALANAYIEELQKQTNRLALTDAAQHRLFFERQLEQQKKALADSEAALKTTQERTGVLQVTSQVEGVIRAMSELRAEIVSREVALDAIKSGATPQNPEVVRQQTAITALKDQLRKLEATSPARGAGNPLIPTSEVPKVGLEYLRALRDLKYNETLFELLAKQYEAAKIDEAKESPVIQVVDFAVPPDLKTWPPRAVLTIVGAVLCGMIGCIIALFSRRFDDPVQAEKLALIKTHLAVSRK